MCYHVGMGETRTEKVTAVMTPTMHDQLAAYAEAHDWTISTAAVNLIRQALNATHRSHGDGCLVRGDE